MYRVRNSMEADNSPLMRHAREDHFAIADWDGSVRAKEGETVSYTLPQDRAGEWKKAKVGVLEVSDGPTEGLVYVFVVVCGLKVQIPRAEWLQFHPQMAVESPLWAGSPEHG